MQRTIPREQKSHETLWLLMETIIEADMDVTYVSSSKGWSGGNTKK